MIKKISLPAILLVAIVFKVNCQTTDNLAFNKPVSADPNTYEIINGDSAKTRDASKAVDGDRTSNDSRWASGKHYLTQLTAGKWADTSSFVVDLADIYSINSIWLYWEAAYAIEYEIQFSLDSLEWTTEYKENAGDGKLDIIKIRSVDTRYVRLYTMIGNMEWAPSIYEIEVYSVILDSANNAPLIANIEKDGETDEAITFTTSDFTSKYADKDNDTLSKVKIVSLPENGKLQLSNIDVTVNQEITLSDVVNLKFVPATGWGGITSFAWKAFDGMAYSKDSALVNLTYPNTSNVVGIQSELKIFPNPVKSELYIESSEFQYDRIEIFDMTGRLVQSEQVSYEPKKHLPISLPNGIYQMIISNKAQLFTHTFIVK